MFGVKTKIKKNLFGALDHEEERRFPSQGSSPLLIRAYLNNIKKRSNPQYINNNLGWLSTPPHPMATWAYRNFLDINPNHLGSWSQQKPERWTTQQLEYASIHAMINLYGAAHTAIEGYITMGGTEGNLYAAWTGNAYLLQHCKANQICLLRTSLTHYSLKKIASITNVWDCLTPLNPMGWNIDPDGLLHSIETLSSKGYQGFLIPLTLGYTNTGTNDDIQAVVHLIKKLQHTHASIHCFIWLDAALNGLITPFVEPNFSPFRSSLIQAMVVDFHKLGGVPYPAGMVLYRKSLRSLIEQPIDYLNVDDTTASGSRPGVSAIGIWTMIHLLGKKGFEVIVRNQLDNKKYFIHELQRILPGTEIISDPNSLTCGVIFHTLPHKTVPAHIRQKYGFYAKPTAFLFTKGIKTERLYKVYFLPHITRNTVRTFIRDLQKECFT